MTSEKTESKSLSDFTQYVRETIAATISKTLAAGVTEDEIDAIITKNYNENKSSAISRVISRIKKQMVTQIEVKSATAVKGLLIGCRDKAGKNAPTRYLLLKKDQKHIEISNFGHTTVFKDDHEFEIPVPSLVTLRIIWDSEFNTWNLVGIDSIDNPSLTEDKIISVLKAVQIDPKKITKEMAWSKETPATPVVIFGQITRINPEVSFSRDENDKVFVDKTFPVIMQDEQKNELPCFNFNLKGKSGKFIRCHIEPQRVGKPTLMVEDITSFCKTAVERYPNEPDKQVKYLAEWFEDVWVFVAGVVSSYRETTDRKTGKDTTNIEIGIAAIIETEEENPDKVVAMGSQSALPTEPPKKEHKKEEPKKEEAPTVAPAQPTSNAPSPMMIDTVSKDIKLWCSAANVEPSSLTLEIVREKAASRYSNVPDGLLIAVIEKIKLRA